MTIAAKTTMAWFSTGKRCGADLTSESHISHPDARDLVAGVPSGEKAITTDLVNAAMTITVATSVAIVTQGMIDTMTGGGIDSSLYYYIHCSYDVDIYIT